METTQTPRPSRSGFAVAGLILGIIAMATAFLPIINNLSFFVALIGLVLAIVAVVGIRKGNSAGMGIAVAGLILCVIAGLTVLGTQAMFSAAIDDASQQLDKMSGDATDDIVGVDVDVALGEFSIRKDGYGIVKSELPVTITNLLDEQATYWVKIEAVDASGSRIADDTVYVNDLGPGQSMTQKAFSYVSSDSYDAMRSARFDIVSVSEM